MFRNIGLGFPYPGGASVAATTDAMSSGAERHVAVALAVVVVLLAVAEVAAPYRPNTWINRDGRFYTNVNATIVEDASLEQHRFAASWYDGSLGWNRDLPASFSNIALGRNGEHWPFHPWIMPVLSTPLFWAFGLIGTLLFNLLGFGLIAGGAFRFARAYVGAGAAALGAIALLFGTAVREYAYDYHVDILLLALFSNALAAIVEKRGFLAGVLVGGTLIIKPTSLMFVPAHLLILWERADLRTLKRAILGGACVLGPVALVNTYLFGRPWWFGYNRVLTVVDGAPVVESDVDAFSTPLAEGLERTWRGHWGLRVRMTLIALAGPGLVWLWARRWRYALAATISAVASLIVFAKYHYEGDRFHWPACLLLVPALAMTLDLVAAAVRRLARRITLGDDPTLRAAVAAAVLAVIAGFALHVPFREDLEGRVGRSAYVTGALAWAGGDYDLRDVPLGDAEMRARSAETSIASRDRFGHWIPRAAPPAVTIATPFAAAGGAAGLVFLHLIALGVMAFSGTRLVAAVIPAPIAAALGAGALLLAPVREMVLAGGPLWLASAAALAAADLAVQKHWAWAGALAALAAWLADAPWPVVLLPPALAAFQDRRSAIRAGAATGITVAAWGLIHLVVLGRPFASPEDFVVVGRGDAFETFRIAPPSAIDALAAAFDAPGRDRAFLVLAWTAPFGLLLVASKRASVALALLAIGAAVWVPGSVLPGRGGAIAPALVVAAALAAGAGLAVLVRRVARSASRSPRRIGVMLASVLGLLFVAGVVDRVALAAAPFRIASERAVRDAEVILREDIPCDFLAWEHLSWECSHHDRGVFGLTGLATSAGGPMVGGEPRRMLVLPTGTFGDRRRIRWRDVEAGRALELEWALADATNPGVELVVRVAGAEVLRETLLAPDAGRIHTRTLDTTEHAGRPTELELEVRNRGRPSVVAVDGVWR